LVNITLPVNLTHIGNSAFSWSTTLPHIYIPSSVHSMGTSVFSNCPVINFYMGHATETLAGWESRWSAGAASPLTWNVAREVYCATYELFCGVCMDCETLFNTPPGQVTLVSPDDGAVDMVLRPTLTWEQPTGAGLAYGYHIYRDYSADPYHPDSTTTNRVATVIGATNTSWTFTADLATDTTYYWQVVAYNSAGYGEASVSRSFATMIIPPTPVVLYYPDSNATDVSITPFFTWIRGIGGGTPVSYRIEISTDAEFEDIFIYATIDAPETIFNVTSPHLDYDTIYHWRVIAVNTAGESVGNPVRSFRAMTDVPGIPTAVSPNDGAVGLALRPTLTWEQPTTGGLTYGYHIYRDFSAEPYQPDSTTTNRVATVIGATNTSWTFTADLATDTTYHWQVVAYNDAGYGEASLSRSFTTMITPPNPVVLDLPNDNATDVYIMPYFTWIRGIGGGTPVSYRIEISTDAEFEDIFIYSTIDAPTTIFTVTSPHLAYDTIYHWRVIAINTEGESTENPVRSFQTMIDVPGIPTLVSPPNGSAIADYRPVLAWSVPTTGGEPDGYYVYLSSEEFPYNPMLPELNKVAIISESSVTTWQPDSDLTNESIYHWQIVAFNETGIGAASESWSFDLAVPDTDKPVEAKRTELIGNYPNPFNPETKIVFTVGNITRSGDFKSSERKSETFATNMHVSIHVFNIRGQRVRTLVDGIYPTGTHSVAWNGTDDFGREVSSGVYLYRMTVGEYSSLKRMLLLK
jgi:hypothetical protein